MFHCTIFVVLRVPKECNYIVFDYAFKLIVIVYYIECNECYDSHLLILQFIINIKDIKRMNI